MNKPPYKRHHFKGGGHLGRNWMRWPDRAACGHCRLPLLYARESDHVGDGLETVTSPNKIKKVVKQYGQIKRMVFPRRRHKVRALFERENLPDMKKKIRNQIKREGFWMR